MEDEYTDGPDQAQKVQDGREDIPEHQPFLGQACLHRRGSDFASKLQGTMRPEKVVMALQQLEMIFQPPQTPGVTEGTTPEVGSASREGAGVTDSPVSG